MDIKRFRGDTYPLEFLLVDSVTKEPLDLQGTTLTFTVDPSRNPVDDTHNIFSIEGFPGLSPGLVEFRPTADQVDVLGRFFYDIQLIDSSSFIKTIQKGRIMFTQDITK